MNRLAVLQIDVDEIVAVLGESAPLEDGCFMLLREGRGITGTRFLASDPFMPPEDAWDEQGRGRLRPSARYVSAAISRAVSANAGLLFLHSHPDPDFPAGFSPVDEEALVALAETVGPILDGPFGAAVVHPTGWIARILDPSVTTDIDRVVAVGRALRPLDPPTEEVKEVDDPLDARQKDALGIAHDRLRSSKVAVVGAGGLGSPIAEQLVRMGVGQITLIDHDLLDTPSNVRRVFGSTRVDLMATQPPRKVDVVGRHLDHLALGNPIRRVGADIRRESAFRELLDADAVICGTDTHGSRAVINDLGSTYFLPVIDVGVQAGAKKNGDLAALVAEVRVITPVTPCLWCRESISADVIRAENLPIEQRERLEKEGYVIGGVGAPAPSVVALTVLGAGLATCALIALMSSEGEFCPSGYVVDGLMGDGFEVQPTEPKQDCRCRTQLGLGDTSPPPLLPDK